jgi:hypothetical protein
MVLPGVAKRAALGCAVTVPPPNDPADQLRAIVPAHAQPFVPHRARGALWPEGDRRPLRPVGCMRGLDSSCVVLTR